MARLTQLPIIADVAVASETAKTKADIVVHENKNNQMEEIFRAMRTNVQFMLREGQKVIMFTSTTSGEGKTFNCANLAVSFALLGKKVVLVGLDIRKPRLAELFEIDDHKHGITPLLAQEHPSEDDVRSQILPQGVNGNLDLLLAGPVPPNPSELISRQSLEIVINILKDNYDYVLIDTAPVGLVTDTLQVGRVIDATIYMCRADYTPKSSFDLVNSLPTRRSCPTWPSSSTVSTCRRRSMATTMATASMASTAATPAMASMATMVVMAMATVVTAATAMAMATTATATTATRTTHPSNSKILTMVIAVDFDGTIVEHRYPEIGPEIPFAIDTLKMLIADSHKVILWTVREGQTA